ncbi:permease [Accumulibacter sp.]|uniref:permease n=1 Tax=Accumulibacter sp. TaxID=2053492 RepID=UPI00263A0CA2|nr:permease [Accumulibacter sp.]
MDVFTATLQSGLASLASYLAAHVLLCLVPAFFIAGALAALVPQQSIIRFLGPDTAKFVSYPAAAAAGSLLAVCSCTVQPLFAGIYTKGAGLGPAITFLFFAPAANILALSYTGVALGADYAIARIILSLCFGIGIGLLMALLFHRSDHARTTASATFAERSGVGRQTLLFLGFLVALLVFGTLKVQWLTLPLFGTVLPFNGLAAQNLLDRLVPANEIKGEEGLSLQGLALVGLLLAIGAVARRGLGQVDSGFTRQTWAALGLTVATLVFAALGVRVAEEGLAVTVTGRTLAVSLCCAILITLARRFDAWDIQQWLWETWRFVKMIFPLLLIGVFLVGVVRSFIRPEWVQFVAGENTVLANLAGVVFGVFMYFPTLVEVPIAKMFLSLGMHPGPLIAYLMADPELSLQSILISSAIIGKLKAWTYVGLVALFSTVAGLTYGAWVDGTPLTTLALIVGAGILAPIIALQLIERSRAVPFH